jgi:hypothetical protein
MNRSFGTDKVKPTGATGVPPVMSAKHEKQRIVFKVSGENLPAATFFSRLSTLMAGGTPTLQSASRFINLISYEALQNKGCLLQSRL